MCLLWLIKINYEKNNFDPGNFSFYQHFISWPRLKVTIYNPNANAKEDIASAVKKAKAENKQVLLQIGGNWCPWCVKLDGFMATDTQIDSLLKADYCVMVNYSKENKNVEVLKSAWKPATFRVPGAGHPRPGRCSPSYPGFMVSLKKKSITTRKRLCISWRCGQWLRLKARNVICSMWYVVFCNFSNFKLFLTKYHIKNTTFHLIHSRNFYALF